ncbi:MAG: septum site-determining protein MinC [Clostridia bacterium]|nr:septum site-determining protein MinC [Clostridia bacterium]
MANVTIKGNGSGIEIVLSEKATYPVLREELLAKLKKHAAFFRNTDARVIIRGKELSPAQRKELKRVFAMDFGILDLLYGDEADLLREVERTIEAARHSQPASTAGEEEDEFDLTASGHFGAESMFVHQTVRSGQRIECEGDVVIIGDVNAGAEVMAGGSIAVFGKLRGLAHAGCGGRRDVCVAAIHMCPKQLRLSGRVVSFDRERPDMQRAEVAELDDEGRVVIRPVSSR